MKTGCPIDRRNADPANVTCRSCHKQGVACPFPWPGGGIAAPEPILEESVKPRKSAKKKGVLPGKYRGENLQLVLPFKLPTWNQLLAMDQWQRRKVRNWIKERVSECIQSGDASRTQTGLVLRLRLTDLSLEEYSQMIVPNSSRRYLSAKKSARKRKRLST